MEDIQPPLPDWVGAVREQVAARRLADALRLVPPGTADPLALGLRRMCLARLGRWEEAAAAGDALLASGAASVEDHYRQAQILNRLGHRRRALDLGLRALRCAPDDVRLLVPPLEAALAEPDLAPALVAALTALPSAPRPPAPPEGAGADGTVLFPIRLAFGGTGRDHPSITGLTGAATGVRFEMGSGRAGMLPPLVAGFVPQALRLCAALCAVHPTVDRAAAAAFVANRVHEGLADDDSLALDFFSPFPLSVGKRPFVLCHDYLPSLFQPFLPFEDTTVDPRSSPWYWMTKALLESDHCLAILSHQPRTLGHIAGFFESRVIEARTTHVNVHQNIGADPVEPAVSDQGAPGTVTLLFTASATFTDENFYLRGGVNVLAAFATLSAEFPELRLIVRSPAPATLGPRLRAVLTGHPGIEWYPDFVPLDRLAGLHRRSDLFLMPGAILYRNGLVGAMRYGIVPVVADMLGIEDFIEDGVNGAVVKGRRYASITGRPPVLRQHLTPLIQAVDEPADAAFQAALVGTLRGLVADPGRRAALAARCRADAGRLACTQTDVTRFEGVIRDCLARSRRMRQAGIGLSLPCYE